MKKRFKMWMAGMFMLMLRAFSAGAVAEVSMQDLLKTIEETPYWTKEYEAFARSIEMLCRAAAPIH